MVSNFEHLSEFESVQSSVHPGPFSAEARGAVSNFKHGVSPMQCPFLEDVSSIVLCAGESHYASQLDGITYEQLQVRLFCSPDFCAFCPSVFFYSGLWFPISDSSLLTRLF